MFNVARLELARKRRRHTGRSLSEKAGVSSITLSRIVNKKQAADRSTILALVRALDYPEAFFFKDDPEPVNAEAVSFRSLTGMTAREREAALSAGSLALEVIEWVSERFELPSADLLDLSAAPDPSSAARMLRQYWSIGEKPIGNLIKLIESKGVRVFSLTEDTRNVDAFSCWRGDQAFVFLNTFKSTERSRFDAAHELGHLVLHKHGGPRGREAEDEANQFASSFLMPQADLKSKIPFVTSVEQIVRMKGRWGVSAVALAYRLNKLHLLSEWQYVQVNRLYRSSEPDSLPPEKSTVWGMVLQELWRDGLSRSHIAAELKLPDDELASLLFGLTGDAPTPARQKPALRAV